LGRGLILGRRGSRLRGVVLSLVGVAAVSFITVIHSNEGSAHGLHAYACSANACSAKGCPKPKFHMSLPTIVTGMLTHPVSPAVPVKKQVWFVVVPFQGIETQSTAQSMEIIG
jgi:hypothetical protein